MTLVPGVLTVKINVTRTVIREPVMLKLVIVTVNLGTMAIMRTVIDAAVDVTTHVMLSLADATAGLGGMEINVTLGKSVSQLCAFSHKKMFAQFKCHF